MGAFLSYSIVSGIILLCLALAYRLLLAPEKQHGYNRAVILAIYTVSFTTLPMISLIQHVATIPQPSIIIENIDIVETIITPNSKPIWGTILIWIFILGMIAVIAKTTITWWQLAKIVRSGDKIKKNGYTIIVTENSNIAPFSWLHYIVLYRKDYDAGCSAIIEHELKHVSSAHWFDLIIAQIVCIINWYNPAAWLMRNELKLVHEYQADMAVLHAGHNAQEYQILLIKKAIGTKFQSLANSLNHNNLKKRINMMYQKKSSTVCKFKALALVPILVLAISVTTASPVRAAISTISDSEATLGNSNEQNATPQVNNAPDDVNEATSSEKALLQAEVMPQYPGGMSAMMQAVMSKCKFPNPDKEWKEGADGKAVIQFTVFSDGKAGDFYLVKSTGDDELDQIALTAAQEGLVEPWTPGMTNGKPVAVKFTIPIVFKPSQKTDTQQVITISNKSRVESTTNSMAVSIDSEKGVEIEGINPMDIKNLNIYIDDQKSTYEQMNALDPNSIVSMSVDKAANAVRIVTRK